jgi:hypothetical protein
MAKDKRAKHFNMAQLAKEAPVKEAPMRDHVIKSDINFDDDFDNKLKEYNANIADVNDVYKTTTPRFDILCRVFTRPLERTEGGLIKANLAPIQANTKAGVGNIYIEDPFSWDRKAMVVNAPSEVKDLKEGDIVYIASSAIQKEILGSGDDALPRIRNSFVHPDLGNPDETPMNPDDINYGYMLIPPYEIKIIL